MIYRQEISKEEINDMPLLSYPGRKIIVVDDPGKAVSECALLMKAPLLGFDTETRPSFTKGERHKISLLQIADEECCRLFRLNMLGMPHCVKALLTSPEPLKIGLSLRDDFRQLSGRGLIRPQGFVELQHEVKKAGINEMSLQKIYAIMFGMKISKNARLSNWDSPSLQPKQQEYAAIDAWACIDIYKKLHEQSAPSK